MYVSIIIPVYNDWGRLSLCLDALSRQTYEQSNFEILVVNNQPCSKPPEGLKMPINAILYNESKPGSYAARNTGIAACKGVLIGFTDSDCIPDEHWISAMVNYFISNPSIGRAGGRIELFYKSPVLNNIELYEQVFAFNQELYVNADATAVTANLFTYKNAFITAGLFDDTLMSGGDYEWSKRAQAAGINIGYSCNAIVKHPARFVLHELVIKAKRVGGGQAKFTTGNNGKIFKRLLKLAYDLRPPVKTIAIIRTRGRSLNLKQKITVFFLRYYLSALTAKEKFGVLAGKIPHQF